MPQATISLRTEARPHVSRSPKLPTLNFPPNTPTSSTTQPFLCSPFPMASTISSRSFLFPPAPSPEIIRSHQKDAFFTSSLNTQLTSLARSLYGARAAHAHAAEAHTLAELLYFGLTTLLGNRTLGEEYCDIVQVETSSSSSSFAGAQQNLPTLARRAVYILASVVAPYALNRELPRMRRLLRARLERNASSSSSTKPAHTTSPSRTRDRARRYVLANLDALTSPAPVLAVSLAAFYFSGVYYHLGKRVAGLRYIFTRRVELARSSSTGGVEGYEVLGMLLGVQLAVQAYLHVRESAARMAEEEEDEQERGGRDAGGGEDAARRAMRLVGAQQVDKVELANPGALAWMAGERARRCTLCLEEMTDPSATPCGHVFCWTCVGDWCREKPECPLCRQACLVQHVLPLRG